MRGFSLICMLALLLAVAVPARAEDGGLTQVPSCARECVSNNLANQSCDPLRTSDGSCACRDVAALDEAKLCFASSCSSRDKLRALELTAITCNEPIRDKGRTYRIVNITFFILAVISIIFRWSAHASVGRINWLDEANMFIVLVLDVLLFSVCLKMSYTGLGHDMWRVPFSQITSTLFYFWITEFVYFTLLGFIKIQFLLFYLQIFPDKRFRRLVWSVIIGNGAAMIAFCFAAVFVCSPTSFAWLQWDGEHSGHCVNNNSLAYSHAAFNVILDFVALSLPIPQIWNLQLSMRKKIGVLLMFGVGTFVTIVSIIRLRALVHFANTTNMTWDYLEASLWSMIEWEVGIICVCMPSIRLGLARLFPKLLGSSAHESKPTYDGTGHGRRSEGNTLAALSQNGINVQTTFRVSHARKPQTNDDERSFVQLVEIDGDAKSAVGSSKS